MLLPRVKSLFCAFSLALIASSGWAQSSACSANEDVVSFNFAAAASTSATGSSGTWAAGNTGGTYSVATPGTLRANTITFNVSIAGAVWVAGYPAQGTQGGVANSLDLNMDSAAPGDTVTMLLNFNRPMSKVRFNMYDVDQSTGWQDTLRISGSLNGNAMAAPTLSPTTPGNYSVATVGNASEITTTATGNCASTDGACNVQIDFSGAVNQIAVLFVAGPAVTNPTSQRVGFNNFSYCVPKRDLSLTKVDSTSTFVAGQTGTYTLSVTNNGGAATSGNVTVTDVLANSSVSFTSPQSPGGGWTCTLSSSSYTNDTATCVRSTSIAANSSVQFPLTVAVNPDATAASFDNRAKVFGGGDEFKTTLTSTGPIANCSSTNEGTLGGGTNTNAGCAFENTLLARQGALTITKSNALTSVTAGQTTTYTLTASNAGPSTANNAVLTDPAVAGLSCTSVTCSVASGSAVCPVAPALSIANLQSSGVTISTLPANSSLNFQVQCTVTASGTP